jgi:hypothetical protein
VSPYDYGYGDSGDEEECDDQDERSSRLKLDVPGRTNNEEAFLLPVQREPLPLVNKSLAEISWGTE